MKKYKIEDLEIGFSRSTPAQVRKRIFLIHGAGSDSRVFASLEKELAKKHDVVSIDLPGHGTSNGSGFRGTVDHAAYCSGLLRKLEWKNCVVLGHSMGGAIALSLSIYFPDLVKSLILVGSGARLRVSPEVLENARLEAAGKKSQTGTHRVGFSERTDNSLFNHIRELSLSTDPEVVLKDWMAVDSFDIFSRLKHIKQDTLAICGEDDVMTTVKYHEFLCAEMPHCKLEVVKDAGHWPFIEKPQQVLKIIVNFLG